MVGKDLGLRYLEGLAKAWGGTVISGDTMIWVGHHDRSDFRIPDVEDKYDEWREVIRQFLHDLIEVSLTNALGGSPSQHVAQLGSKSISVPFLDECPTPRVAKADSQAGLRPASSPSSTSEMGGPQRLFDRRLGCAVEFHHGAGTFPRGLLDLVRGNRFVQESGDRCFPGRKQSWSRSLRG